MITIFGIKHYRVWMSLDCCENYGSICIEIVVEMVDLFVKTVLYWHFRENGNQNGLVAASSVLFSCLESWRFAGFFITW